MPSMLAYGTTRVWPNQVMSSDCSPSAYVNRRYARPHRSTPRPTAATTAARMAHTSTLALGAMPAATITSPTAIADTAPPNQSAASPPVERRAGQVFATSLLELAGAAVTAANSVILRRNDEGSHWTDRETQRDPSQARDDTKHARRSQRAAAVDRTELPQRRHQPRHLQPAGRARA